MPSIKDAMMHEVCPASVHPQSKVTIVGTGQVGMAAAFSMMSQVTPLATRIFEPWFRVISLEFQGFCFLKW